MAKRAFQPGNLSRLGTISQPLVYELWCVLTKESCAQHGNFEPERSLGHLLEGDICGDKLAGAVYYTVGILSLF